MLTEKAGLLLLYLALVLVVCAWPFALRMRAPAPPWRAAPLGLGGALALAAAGLLLARGMPATTSPLLLSLLLIPALMGQGVAPLIGGLVALPLLAGVTWWAPALELSLAQAVLFLLLGVGAASLPRLWRAPPGLPMVIGLAGLAVFGVAAALLTGVFSTPIAFWALWHHWGAFVAPAEAMLAGGVPFRDFPVQYGMGPTLLIASLCQGDCWEAAYWAVAASNLLYLLALGACALLLTRDADRGVAVLGLAAMLCAVLLWSGYPPDFMGALATPSVSGLRFVPLALLLLHVLRAETAERPMDGRGHALWFLALCWSPEAGFQASLVWWPYLALRRAAGVSGFWPLVMIIATGALRAVLALLLALAVIVVGFWLGFGDWPSLEGFLTYVRNPPGVLHPNLLGPIWLALAVLAVALLAMAWGDARSQRVGFVCVAGFLAVSSYYLGRSHDNNLLNLFPFLVLAILTTVGPGLPTLFQAFSRVVMAGVIAWTATFGMGGWNQAARDGVAGQIGPARLLEQMSLTSPAAQALMDAAPMGAGGAPFADLGMALTALRQDGAGSPLIVNAAMISARGMPGPGWTGMHNLATYALLPPPTIEHFIRRGAEVYRRPGWILMDRGHPNPWLERFGVAYDVTEERVFGGYTAYRVVPR